jgi:hypothetical protein
MNDWRFIGLTEPEGLLFLVQSLTLLSRKPGGLNDPVLYSVKSIFPFPQLQSNSTASGVCGLVAGPSNASRR